MAHKNLKEPVPRKVKVICTHHTSVFVLKKTSK